MADETEPVLPLYSEVVHDTLETSRASASSDDFSDSSKESLLHLSQPLAEEYGVIHEEYKRNIAQRRVAGIRRSCLQFSHACQRKALALRGSWHKAHQRELIGLILGFLAFVHFYVAMTINAAAAPDSNSFIIAPSLQQASFNRSLGRCREAWGPLPGPAKDFRSRRQSDRFASGTPDVFIRNATIWTGNADGNEVLKGDVVLSKGMIETIAAEGAGTRKLGEWDVEIDAKGAWLTPGIFDMHSHIGIDPLPELSGAEDTNSRQKPVLPYLRSLDGFNTHDEMFRRARSGGVTTAMVLPGSANNIGGQAFLFKLRETKEHTPASMMLEPPFTLPFAAADRKEGDPPRWRHMKNACGENIRRVYKETRMDLAWNFRSAFDKARTLKRQQDAFCAELFQAEQEGKIIDKEFPDDLEWEALVDVLRGKVKVNTHCYEETDLQAYVDHTREFEYPLAAFHHAHEAYLVPDLLKQTWGGTPAAAIFATNGRYKREAWRGSEFAPRILAENKITVVVKSDHPVLNSQYLVFEAQQTHHFGLPANLALAAVTTSPARVQGVDHRIGFIRPGYDADLVLWDSHPLQLGATPKQVFIDGILQLDSPVIVSKPHLQQPPNPADLETPADPTKAPVSSEALGDVLFTDISTIFSRRRDGAALEAVEGAVVGVSNGKIVCIGSCDSFVSSSSNLTRLSLNNGTLTPGIIGFGPALGLADLISEASTQDGSVFDPLESESKLGKLKMTTPRAVDDLQFGGKHLRYAERFGVTKAVTAPMGEGVFRGVSVAFRTGAANVLEKEAIIRTSVAMHVTIGHDSSAPPSISTQIGVLRRLLITSINESSLPRLLDLGASLTSSSDFSSEVVDDVDYFALCGLGNFPLVVNVWKADHMATLLHLKSEVESNVARLLASSSLAARHAPASMRLIFHGGQEAHLIAKDIALANVGVIVSPPRPLPESWDERRATPSLPLAEAPLPVLLERAGVKVGLGVPEEWEVMQLAWEAGWAIRNSNATRETSKSDVEGRKELGKETAWQWLTTNIEDMLGLPRGPEVAVGVPADFVAWKGNPLDFGSSVAGVVEGGKIAIYS